MKQIDMNCAVTANQYGGVVFPYDSVEGKIYMIEQIKMDDRDLIVTIRVQDLKIKKRRKVEYDT